LYPLDDRDYAELYPLTWDWAKKHHLVAGERLLSYRFSYVGLTEEEIEKRRNAFNSSPELTFFVSFAWFAILASLDDWRVNAASQKVLEWKLPQRPPRIGDAWGALSATGFLSSMSVSAVTATLISMSSEPIIVRPFEERPKSIKNFQCPLWDPLEEKRSTFRRQAIEHLTRELDIQLDQSESAMRCLGKLKVPRKVSTEHFDWLVDYQLLGNSFPEIKRTARDASSRQTVDQGVKDAAEAVVGPCWKKWLRPGKRGRPRKS
jgi:hypothetical protein